MGVMIKDRINAERRKRRLIRIILFLAFITLTSWFLYTPAKQLASASIFTFSQVASSLYASILAFHHTPSLPQIIQSTDLNEFLQKTPAEWCCDYDVTYSAPGEYLLTRRQKPRESINIPNSLQRMMAGHSMYLCPTTLPSVRQIHRAKELVCKTTFAGQIVVTAMSEGKK